MSEALPKRPTVAEITLENLAYNLRSVKKFIRDDVRYMAVVKADAYGHGAIECSRQLEKQNVDWLAVALPEEGIELRNAGIKVPILCLSGFWGGQETALLRYGITPAIFDLEKAEALDLAAGNAGTVALIHVKVDTGMGRVGVPAKDVYEFAAGLKRFKYLDVEGIMTHFAVADDLAQIEFTNRQIEQFRSAVAAFRELGFDPKYEDLANSPGAIAHPSSRQNMVRLGGVLYGLGADVLPTNIDVPDLRPVMSLRTEISFLKKVSAGSSVGYGRTFIANRDSVIATLPIGYYDGYPRVLSNRARVLLNGCYAPVSGRISMDWTTVDVTDVPDPKVGDEVILIGESGGLAVRAEDIAAAAGTISYEITCGISSRVPRIIQR
jgi:alanine racemase